MKTLKQQIERANVQYHTKLSETYDKDQPYFKPENTVQVKARLKKFSSQTHGRRILDLGCGTGFMLKLAEPYFKELYGVDITPAMLAKARPKFKNKSASKLQLELSSSEKLKFFNDHFDVVTAYSFLHHLERLDKTIAEAYRVLRKGGVFYSDQDPNYYFWQSMNSLKGSKDLSGILSKERDAVCKMAHVVQSSCGEYIGKKIVEMAEYQKTKGGFREERIKQLFKKIGFSQINYEYNWFWQQGRAVHELSSHAAVYFEEHLRQALPLTRHFFKYIRIIAIK